MLAIDESSWMHEGVLSVSYNADDDDMVGAVYAATDEYNHYRFQMDQETGQAWLVTVRDGVPIKLADVPFTRPSAGQTKIVRSGYAHEIYVDGVHVLDATDHSHADGHVGVFAWAMDEASFSQVEVTL